MTLVPKEAVENCKCKDTCISNIGKYENEDIPQMKNLMQIKYGVGLAAPQVGIYRRFFIMRYGSEIISCYNPTWTPKSNKKTISKEGCLTYQPSWKNHKNVMRYKIINVEFVNASGNLIKLKLRGRDAIVFQHECDHLDGITIFNPRRVS